MNNKRIILMVGIGNSPQVLTEMVWEMAHLKTPVVPDEIVALAAKNSAEKLKKEVLDGGDKSVWSGLLSALKREKIDVDGKLRFGTASIAVLPDSVGNEMQDLRSGDDSLSAADFILGQLRRFTESPDTIVYASIAGGRKTMSALLFSCMTLVGRDQDKIVHVLPPVELEGKSEPVFYYPQKGVKFVSERTKKSYKGEKLRSEYLEIPFVRTRGWYQDKFKSQTPSYQTLVRGVQEITPSVAIPAYPKLEIDFDGVGHVRILPARIDARLSASAFLLVALIAKGVPRESWVQEMYRLRQKIKNVNDHISVDCNIDWYDKYVRGKKFTLPGDDKMSWGDLSDCMNELRRKLAHIGFERPEALSPKYNDSVIYPRENFVYCNEEELPPELRNLLLPPSLQ